jgi:hypothetical protein
LRQVWSSVTLRINHCSEGVALIKYRVCESERKGK